MERSLLGGLSPRAFLRRHWQKRPLLVRGALSRPPRPALRALAALAARDDVESRLVRRRGAQWRVAHGPLAPRALHRLPARDWTLLVQGLNHHVPAADSLLRRFAFVPQARLDDVMASYAAPGGGVGPHWDSYDVFLVQAAGRRVWRICAPRRFAERPAQPLRLIEGFEAEDEFLLEPGDLLYLPPGWGHDGVALDASVTLSVGFRAPDAAQLSSAFLEWLAERERPARRYRDPDLRPARHPAEIDAAMRRRVRGMLRVARWDARDEDAFLGSWLTTPKAHVVFYPPSRPLSRAAFDRRLPQARLALDPRTQLLYDAGGSLYVNGEALHGAATPALRALADARNLAARRLERGSPRALAYDWYRAGYLRLA